MDALKNLLDKNIQAIKNEEVVYGGLTESELRNAFDSVKDPSDWKGPIDRFVDESQLTAVVKAIQYYTGTEPIVAFVKDSLFNVRSIGYRHGPCGDH